MQKRFGAPIVDPDEYVDPDDDDSGEFRFAEFQLRLEHDAKAGMYFAISSDDVGRGRHDAENAGLCMSEWAAKYGAADTHLYLAFDAEGTERGRKSVANELHGVVKVQLLEPAWLREHRVTRLD